MGEHSRRFLGMRRIAPVLLLILLSLGACSTGGPSTSTLARTGSQAAGTPLLVLTDRVSDAEGSEHEQVEADLNGKQQWAVALPASGKALAAANGEVYVGAGATVSALDAQTGHQRWSASASPAVRSIQVIGAAVYVDTGGGFTGQEQLLVFSPDGRLLWQYRPPNDQDMPVWVVDSGVFYTVTGGLPPVLIARDAASGAERWEAPLQLASLPVALLPVGPDAVLVVTQEQVLLQQRDGTQTWQRAQTQVVAAEVLDGTLYAFCVDQPASIGGCSTLSSVPSR